MPLIRNLFFAGWIGFCAVSLMAQTRLLLDLPLMPGWIDGFVFGGTVFGYYFTHPAPHVRWIAWGAGLLGGVSLLFAWEIYRETPWVAFVPFLLWSAYYGFKRPGNSGLRSRPFAKPLSIALTWAWVTVWLPVSPERWAELLLIFLGRASFIFALALAYDLVDLEYDRRHGLRTLTSRLGLERSFALIYKVLIVSGVFVTGNFLLGVYPGDKAAALLFSLLFAAGWMHFVLIKVKNQSLQKPLIDGMIVLQFLMVWATSYL